MGVLLLFVLKDVVLGGPGTGSSDNVGHIPVWGTVRSLSPVCTWIPDGD